MLNEKDSIDCCKTKIKTMEFERKVILKEIQDLKQTGRIDFLGFEPTRFENKNTEKSLILRKQANRLFAKKNHDEKVHEEIWKMYTKSIAYASSKSEELAAGYANRSALLLHLKKYNECILDIDRALKITDYSALRVKLYCRQSECCAALPDGKEKASLINAKLWLDKIGNTMEKEKLKGTIEKTEKVIYARNSESVKQEKEYDIVCNNQALRMSYNEKYGRHLVADRDIGLGELVYVEKFYVTTVNTAKFYAYCSHCLALCWATVPCDHCSFYLYCSEKCKKEAWQKYHDIECAVKFGKHPENHDSYNVQLGLRAFIMGFKEAGNIEKLRELINDVDKCKDLEKRGVIQERKFSSDNLRSLYSLSCSKSVEKIKACIPEILKVLVALAQNKKTTHVLGKDFEYTNNTNLMNEKNAIFIASLFLRLSSISYINAFEVTSANSTCEKYETFFDCMAKFCCSRGMNISLFTSFINHSCDNNVDKIYTNDGRVIYYAARPIKKNSQIFSSYYCKFGLMSKAFRHRMLNHFFEFRCECTACENDWCNPIELPFARTEFIDAIYQKHTKVLEKLSRGKRHRHNTNTIRSFIQDTELLLKSYKQPHSMTYFFLIALTAILDNRYFVILDVPSTCNSNENK